MRGIAVPTTEVFRAISMKARQMPSMAASEAIKLRSDGFIKGWCGCKVELPGSARVENTNCGRALGADRASPIFSDLPVNRPGVCDRSLRKNK